MGILCAHLRHRAAAEYTVLSAPQNPPVLLDVLLPHVYSCSKVGHLARQAIGKVQTYLVR
jgi:hypothetical protein